MVTKPHSQPEMQKLERQSVLCLCPHCRCRHYQYLDIRYLDRAPDGTANLCCDTCRELYSHAMRIRCAANGQLLLPFGPLE